MREAGNFPGTHRGRKKCGLNKPLKIDCKIEPAGAQDAGHAPRCSDAALHGDATLGRLGAGDDVGLQTGLGLAQAALEEGVPLVEARVADLEVLTQPREACCLGFETGAGLATRTCCCRFCGLVGLETRYQCLEVGDVLSLALHSLVGIGGRQLQRLHLAQRLE